MKNVPNSKANLDRALQRFAGDFARANDLRGQMANAIVAQMIGDGVVKGGSGLRFRYGEKLTRVTMDLDTAWKTDLDAFLKMLKERLAAGWNGFSGEARVLAPAKPRGIPFLRYTRWLGHQLYAMRTAVHGGFVFFRAV